MVAVVAYSTVAIYIYGGYSQIPLGLSPSAIL